MFGKFGFIKVSPPSAPEDLEGKIEELRKIKAEYDDKGKSEMDGETEVSMEELRKQADRVLREREESERYGDGDGEYRPRGRGRGGRGDHGDREGRGGGRGGRGGRRFDDHETKDEPTDDVEHPKEERKERKKKAGPLKDDEENFPTLTWLLLLECWTKPLSLSLYKL